MERACDMDQSGEVDLGGAHDTGRSDEDDPVLPDLGGLGMGLRW